MTREIRIEGGTIEAHQLPGGASTPLLVLGGVETGLRRLAGTESVLRRRWQGRAARRAVTIVGRPIPHDPADAERLMHPRLMAHAVAAALDALELDEVAIEAESGGARIGLWLAVDEPQRVTRLVLASVASETRAESPMGDRMARWIALAEAGEWATFFGQMAVQMKAGTETEAGDFATAARLHPRPATPERFIGELKATLDPSSFVTSRLREIGVPTLVLVGEQDRVVPPDASRQVVERIRGARLEADPDCGHTVRSSFRGYDDLVEAFLAEGD